jgi:hypothetical protein
MNADKRRFSTEAIHPVGLDFIGVHRRPSAAKATSVAFENANT